MRFLISSVLVLISAWSFSQVQNLRGTIIDRDSRTALYGVSIKISSSAIEKTTLSDIDGKFEFLALPVGRYKIECTVLGYETYVIGQAELHSGHELVLDIEMTEQVMEIKESVVTANTDKDKPLNEMATVSARTFSVEETRRFAASFNDPARMAVSFAGVSTTDDASNEIVVRGNSSRGMLWRIEGIEIPNPNHFSNGEGGTGGGISMLSAQVLANSDFFTGAFPAEYGNALSGVFDLRFRRGNASKRSYAFQFGVLGLQASAEGPFKKGKDATYLINYRYSTLKIFNAIGLPIVDNALVPEFQDASFNFYIPTQKAGEFTLFGIGGLSRAGDIAVKDSLQWADRTERFEDKSRQWLGVIGLTHTYFFSNKKTYLKSILSGSVEDFKYSLDSLDNSYVPQNAYNERYAYYAGRVHIFVNHKFNARHILRSGILFSQLFYNIRSAGLMLDEGITGVFQDEKGTTSLLQGYIQWKWRISSIVDFTLGMHNTLLLLNNSYSIEPRGGISIKLPKNQTLSFGGGLHSRTEPVSVYLAHRDEGNGTYSTPNQSLRLTKSAHAVVGHDWKFFTDFRVKTEIYFQYLWDVPVENDTNGYLSILNLGAGFTNTFFINKGFGRNYGAEITLEKFLSQNYYFLLTGSVFKSEYSMGDGNWLETRYSGNYMLNALGGYELKYGKRKQNAVLLNTRIIWRGGNRYTPINLQASQQQGREVVYTEAAYTQKLPDYVRWDASVLFRFNFKKWAFGISVEVQNIINRKNIQRYYFDPYTNQINTSYMFGIMPVFNFKFEF